MSEVGKEIRDYTRSKEFLDKLRADLALHAETGRQKAEESQEFVRSLKSRMGIESLTSRVAALEKEANKPKGNFPVEDPVEGGTR
ncbi:hypothetical protein [Streptomyces sp. NPDC049906]|uniref:hypothetical protein n=1 Tax=Streptomyces sp. NPDC049906 TaxID=3155656 RepID=UPI00342090DA